jgi:hypothetical protein
VAESGQPSHRSNSSVSSRWLAAFRADELRDLRFECGDFHGRVRRRAPCLLRGGGVASCISAVNVQKCVLQHAAWDAICRCFHQECRSRSLFPGPILPPNGELSVSEAVFGRVVQVPCGCRSSCPEPDSPVRSFKLCTISQNEIRCGDGSCLCM